MSDPASYVAGWATLAIYVLAWVISIIRWPRRAVRITVGFGIAVGLVASAELWLRSRLKRDWQSFEELCRTRAGDKVFRTVDGVQGIFRMRARSAADAAGDQFGLEDPYGFAIGDRSDAPNGELLERYRFVETLRAFGAPQSPPYKRHELLGQLGRSERLVEKLESAYGYTWEDLSTREMREKYIAGGRFTIRDLGSNEVLAERTGFVFARHRSGGRDRRFWTNIDNLCPAGAGTPFWIHDFVFSVLRPARPAN